jgi:ABC-type polysaccharide/polyol phosphate transport system ATPase subunit
MKAMIEVSHVSKIFHLWYERPNNIKKMLVALLKGVFTAGEKREIRVIDDLDFTIGAGEFVGIMGRNGVGKSTLLKLISGIYQPTSGRIVLHGTIAPLLELGAGFHEELSGYENIFLNAAILGFSRAQILQTVDQIIEFSELGEKIHMPVRNYSSGMLVRLGFSVATHLAAPILLFDEILAVGDVGFQKKCLAKIEELHSAGRTIVLVTHDPVQIREHCSRCIVIEKGRKVYDGPPDGGAQIYLNTVG